MDEAKEVELDARRVRGASLCQSLHWLASGQLDAQQLTAIYLDAIAAENPRLNAYVSVRADAARRSAPCRTGAIGHGEPPSRARALRRRRQTRASRR